MSPPRRTFVAVDGTALAYRSHFAFINRPLTTKKGEVTSAVFGFILALRRILQQLAPDRVVVVFDAPGGTFRHEMYDRYKATRERMPEDLRSQLPRIFDFLDASGIPRLSIEGVEADDVLATLGEHAVRDGMDALIVSNDKDLLQMVGGPLRVVTLGKASEPPRMLGAAEVEESLGVPPALVVDFLALTGDSSDNVPGVPGVGPKTAAKLLGEHGSLDALLAAADALPQKKLRESLLESSDRVHLSRELVKLRRDVEVPSPDALQARPEDQAALRDLFDELDFQSLRSEVAIVHERADAAGYVCVRTRGDLDRLAEKLRTAKQLTFAATWMGRDAIQGELVGIACSLGSGTGYYVPLAHQNTENLSADSVRDAFAPALESARCWGHDVKQCLLLFERLGLDASRADFDTMLASYVLDPSRRSHGLEDLSRDRLRVEPRTEKGLLGSGKSRVTVAQAPLQDVAEWACEGADVAFRLRAVLEPEIEAANLAHVFRDIELPLMHVLAKIERTGIRLDTEFLAKLSVRMEKELREIEAAARKAAGMDFNLGSPKQVADLLFGKLGLKSKRRTKTGLSTDAEVLGDLADQHEVPKLILRYREVSKLKSTYVDALPAMVNPTTGRVHTTFQQAVAATGRLSSAEPNLQNVPIRTWEGKEIRKAFVPSRKDGVIVSCDYSQIELRILAHMAQDEPLLEAFREDRDVHRATAALIFDVAPDAVTTEQRASAKTINFGVIYGMGAVNLGRSLGISTKEAAGFIHAYFDRYPGVRRFIETTQEKAADDLYVETLAGRRRPIPEIASADHRTRAFGERIAVNTPIQGTAADIMKLAMIAVQKAFDDQGLESRMVLTVHDEIVFDCPADERDAVIETARREMSGAMELSVPLHVDAGYGADWSEAH